MPKFTYLGNGDFLPDIPARDLSAEEAERAGLEVLRESPLYQEVKSSKSKSKPKKEDVNERSN